MRNKLVLISLFFLTATAGSASAADILWTNGGSDGLWRTAANWSLGRVPNNTLPDVDKARINSMPGPLISDGMTAVTNWIACGDGGTGAYRMTGGALTVGTAPGDTWTILGYGTADSGTFTMDGGAVTTADRVFVGFQGTGTLNMNGGTMTIGGMFGIGHSELAPTGHGTVNLAGGTIMAADFQMASPAGCTGLLDITGGTLIINGDKQSLINDYITNGWIKAYGGASTVLVDYISGKTVIQAYIISPKAQSPVPIDNAIGVMPYTDLRWTAGSGAVSHNVYFGTASPGTFRGNQTETAFSPGQLAVNTTYYWRIDEVNEANTITGIVWKFTTTGGLAKNPNPGNGVTGVALDKVLRWTTGYDAFSHDVYFGTDANGIERAERLTGDLDGSGQVNYSDLSILTNYWLANPAGSQPYAGVNDDNIVDFFDYAQLSRDWMNIANPVFKGNQDGNSFNPGTLALNTTYYWRIDEVNGPNTVKGDVWSFTTTAIDSNYSLVGKIMCGYQGWFNTPTDGANRGWVHWGNGSFLPTSCNVDLWPDMTEMGADEKFLADNFFDGSDHYVFSSHNRNTVLRHFQWMQDYGIDGVYMQRFATELTPGSVEFNHRNVVFDYCKDGANMYGRKYAVMYDLSGLGTGGTQRVIDDWKFLVDTKKVGRDPNDHGYMFHKGKPVVSVWGIGFNDGRQYTLSECLALVNFLKNDPVYGGNIVMIGVPSYWRILSNDCVSDPMVHTIIRAADIVSPWAVGRYGDSTGVTNYANAVWIPDIIWCNDNNVEYLPVIFPGFSWHNMHNGSTPLNQIPRNGGQFLWDQVKAAVDAGSTMIYQAMFDEVDEGTAIFKVTNNPPRPGGVDMFVTPSYDGIPLPSDEYLWLVGQAARGLRGEIPVNQTRPAR